MVAVKTPAPERAAGRRKLAAKKQALSDGSFPIPNTGYLKKAIQAVGRAAPGKRPALARLIRKRAKALGRAGMAKLRGSWADTSKGPVAAANALAVALELSRADGTLYELNHRVDLSSHVPGTPYRYRHGWIKVGKTGADTSRSTHDIGRLHGSKHGLAVGDKVRWVEPHGGRPGESANREGHVAGVMANGSRIHVVDHGHPSSSAAAHSEISPGMITHASGPGMSPSEITHTKKSVHPSGTKYQYTKTKSVALRPTGTSKRSGSNLGDSTPTAAPRRTPVSRAQPPKAGPGGFAPGSSGAKARAAAEAKPGRPIPAGVKELPESSSKETPGSIKKSGSGYIAYDHMGGMEHFSGANSRSRAGKFAARTSLSSDHRKVVDLVGPKGYTHGWIYVGGGKAIPKVHVGQHVKANTQKHGKVAGVVTHVSAKPGSHMVVVNVKRSDSGHKGSYDLHAGLVTHTREPGAASTKSASGAVKPFPVGEGEYRSPSKMGPPKPGEAGKPKVRPDRAGSTASRGGDTVPISNRPPGTSHHATPGSTVPGPAHSELLKARTAARKAYPQGHPERLKAERAVRHSRKARRAGAGGGGETTPRAAGATRTSRRRRTPPITATTTTSAAPKGTGKSIAQRQAEFNALSPERKRTYSAAKRAGVGHERAMVTAKGRPVPPKGTQGAARRRATGAGKAGVKVAVPKPSKATPAEHEQVATLAKALEGRGWSHSEALKLAEGRILRGEKIPQFAPGKKGPRALR